MHKYGFIVDGKLTTTFDSSDFVREDMESLKEGGHKVIWVKLLRGSGED